MRRLLTLFISSASLILLAGAPAPLHAQTKDRNSLNTAWLNPGPPVLTPTAFLSFCARNPADCQHGPATDDALFQARLRDRLLHRLGIGSGRELLPASITPDNRVEASDDTGLNGSPSPISLTPSDTRPKTLMTDEMWQTARQVNHDVNRRLRSRSDLSQFGRDDYWFVPDLNADAYGDCEDYVLLKRRLLIENGFAPDTLSIAIVETRRRETHAVLILTTDSGDFILDNLRNSIRPWTEVKYRWISRQSASDPLMWQSLDQKPRKHAGSV
ncbi:transglutaminase-like cysteine peptidase [Asticcacaulis tiandongensis]|uniref:transglutaminase-like cysteine peptidase n=1 Tax=Asticcacaulis tiandongensis TaxID=2565365 RepID=UPI00112B85C0|nr:transglutaminase-like cysteine peptidase [Asticcacaulis tiandongensis]